MVKKLLSDRRGAIALITVLTFAVFIGFASLAMEMSGVYLSQVRLQRALDIGATGAAVAVGNGATASTTANNSTLNTQATAAFNNILTMNGIAYTSSSATAGTLGSNTSGSTTTNTGSITATATVSKSLFLSRAFNGVTSMNLATSAISTYSGSTTTSSSTPTGNNCAVALGSSGISATGGAKLNSGSSSSSCGIQSVGSVSVDNSGSSIGPGSVATNGTATVSGGNSSSGCVIGSSCASGGNVGSNVTQHAGLTISDPVASDHTTAGYIAKIGTATSPSTISWPACNSPITINTPAGWSGAPAIGSTNYSYYQNKTDSNGYYVYQIPAPTSGQTNCYTVTVGAKTDVQFLASATGSTGINIIKTYSSGGNAAVSFGSGIYYFLSTNQFSIDNNTFVSLFPGTYYFAGDFSETENNTSPFYMFYDPSNTSKTGNYNFAGNVSVGGSTAIHWGAGNYNIAKNLTLGNGNSSTHTLESANFDIGGNVTFSGNIIMNGTGNWTINSPSGTALQYNAGSTVSFGCQNTTTVSCVYTINGTVNFGENTTFGNDIFIISGATTFGNGNSTFYTDPTAGVSFFTGGQINVEGALTLSPNLMTSDDGNSGVLLGSTASGTAIQFQSGSSSSLSGVIYAPNGQLLITGGAKESQSSGACLEFVASSISLTGGTSATSTCSGFGGGGSSSSGTPDTTAGNSTGGGSGSGSGSSGSGSSSTVSSAVVKLLQ